MRHRGLLLAVALTLLSAVPALAQDEPRWSLSTSVNYSVGDYGTGKDTTLVYLPVTLGVRPLDRFWLTLTVPYLYQSTQNVVITGGGVAARNEARGKLARPTRSTAESGLGDVLLKGSYVLIQERDAIPEIAPYVKIKFPTAVEIFLAASAGRGPPWASRRKHRGAESARAIQHPASLVPAPRARADS